MTKTARTPIRALTASLAALLALALVLTASIVRVTPAHALTTTPAPSAPPASPAAPASPRASAAAVPVPSAPVESRLVAVSPLPDAVGAGASGSGFAAAAFAASWAPAAAAGPARTVGGAPVHAFAALAAEAAPAPAPAPAGAPGEPGTATLSSAAYDFLTQALGLPLASSVLSGTVEGPTLTVAAGAPDGLAVNLPGGAGTFTLDPATITVDTATKQLTLTASGHAANGIGGSLSVSIARSDATDLKASTDLGATLTVSAIPVLGTSVDVTGNLRYTGGHLAGSITGTLGADAPLTSGVVLQKGATITLDSAAGLSVSGTIALGDSGFSVGLNGTISGLSDWSLTVTQQPGAVVWQPVSGLSISPNVTGTITDAKGTISFDVSTTNVVNWAPGAGVNLAVSRIEISNTAPGADLSCPAGTEQGHLWIDVAGTLSYTPANLSGSAEACVDPAAQAFKISTTINPGSLLPTGAGFTIGGASLAVEGNLKAHTFAVTGSATLTFTTINGAPSFTLGVLFQSDGTVVAGVRADLTKLGFTGDGNLFIANKALKGFDPKTVLPGTTAAPFDLQPGVAATISYTLPAWLTNELAKAKIPVPADSVVQGVASFSAGAFSLSASLSFPGDGAHLFDANGTKVYLQSATIGLSLGDTNSASLSGQVLLSLPPQIPGGQPSSVRLGLNASFNFTTLNLQLGLSLSGACGSATCAWKDAFGISGLSVEQLAGTIGIELDTAVPLPTFSIQAKNVVLPDSWSKLIGVVPGTSFSLAANFNLVQPLLTIDVVGNPVALTPLAIASSDPNVVNSFTVNHASLVLAPLGGTTAGGDVLTPGVSVLFDATVLGHRVHIDGGVGLVPPTIDANVQFGRLDIGSAHFDNTTLHLHVGVGGFDFSFSGGVTDPHGLVLKGTVDLTANTSLLGGSLSLSIVGGLPEYVAVGGSLTGTLSATSSGLTLSASGYGYLAVGWQVLGAVHFDYSWANGALWQQLGEDAAQVARALQNAYHWTAAQTTAALQQLQYNAQQTFSALSAIGDDANQVLAAISNAFHTGRYFIWSKDGQVLDVSGGSRSPGAGVIQYTWHGGANQEWTVVPTDNGFAELVNVQSGECLTVNNTSASAGERLIQWPCYGWTAQQWRFNSGGGYTGIQNRNSGLYADIGGASIGIGAGVDQWYWNGNWNQYFSFSLGG